ncbi:DUF3034 family protein [Neptunicella marina]|uniref:DUF3034 family protein n=1 Tax=Neptunicella marina TaxID=2125989 RepID=A0A8J6IQX4_9ALTE|nr:DUF3034 family protein [Neptunicella marina]MBC3764327.1 DUF3034 family protein [Neptunicella marina]
MKITNTICIILGILGYCVSAMAGQGKILATPGVSQAEGAGGGGIVPWAQLAGYASRDEIAVNGFCSRAGLDDYQLDVCGAQLNLYDRVELSVAKQTFDVPALNMQIKQDIAGVKVRLYGDILYSALPQISVGWQHKSLKDGTIANLLGAKDTRGDDFYVAASKLHLGALAGYNFFWNVTARYTDANQLGLLGFGAEGQHRSIQLEGAAAVFLNPNWAVGTEYRQKPDNMAIKEDDWQDVFIAWFPNKHFTVTAAWLNLGDIAGAEKQTGWYLSISGAL